jgi:hypothetical protein
MKPSIPSEIAILLILLSTSTLTESYRYEDYFNPSEDEYDPFKFDPK